MSSHPVQHSELKKVDRQHNPDRGQCFTPETAPDGRGGLAALPAVLSRQAGGSTRPLVDWLLLVVGTIVVLVALILSPGGLLDKADAVGYAVCHQLPARSYFFGGRQLPLCARCSGQYLGVLGGLMVLLVLRRGRAGLLPPAGIVLLLLGFIALWGFDGLNSYLTFFPGLPHLYEPRNILRLTTGALQGVALISLVLPFFNVTLWAEVRTQRSLASVREVGLLLLVVAVIVGLVSSQVAALLYPLALLSVGGTLLLLILVNTMLMVVLLRREARARTWWDALPLFAAGAGLATLELVAINLIRAELTMRLGLPF